MKIELDVDENEYIKLNTSLNELYSYRKQLNIEYKDLEDIVNTKELELSNINKNISDTENKKNKMIVDTEVTPKTLCTITINGTIITAIVFTGLGIEFEAPIFSLYGTLFYIGEMFATSKIIKNIEKRRRNKVLNSNEYLELDKEITLLKEEKELLEEELSTIIFQEEVKKAVLISIDKKIDTKSKELDSFNNKLYKEIDKNLGKCVEESKPKTKVKSK